MDTIPVIFENGVFRPTVPVALPEATKGSVVVAPEAPEEVGTDTDEIYEILNRRYNSGHSDTAARHNEHQP
jgi:predicted DNA-binding antitoxin AbrB/MazE fold protein